jgi:hypothetical protein
MPVEGKAEFMLLSLWPSTLDCLTADEPVRVGNDVRFLPISQLLNLFMMADMERPVSWMSAHVG